VIDELKKLRSEPKSLIELIEEDVKGLITGEAPDYLDTCHRGGGDAVNVACTPRDTDVLRCWRRTDSHIVTKAQRHASRHGCVIGCAA